MLTHSCARTSALVFHSHGSLLALVPLLDELKALVIASTPDELATLIRTLAPETIVSLLLPGSRAASDDGTTRENSRSVHRLHAAAGVITLCPAKPVEEGATRCVVARELVIAPPVTWRAVVASVSQRARSERSWGWPHENLQPVQWFATKFATFDL